jgi:hypothetical protein
MDDRVLWKRLNFVVELGMSASRHAHDGWSCRIPVLFALRTCPSGSAPLRGVSSGACCNLIKH